MSVNIHHFGLLVRWLSPVTLTCIKSGLEDFFLILKYEILKKAQNVMILQIGNTEIINFRERLSVYTYNNVPKATAAVNNLPLAVCNVSLLSVSYRSEKIYNYTAVSLNDCFLLSLLTFYFYV